jgi:ribosomal protein S18 acetylase RimI-like enzyme
MTLDFHPIDLDAHGDICLRFREDSFICSFGSGDRFWAEADPRGEKYLARLKERMEQLPGSCVHVWKSGEIVGQVEMWLDHDDSFAGYVNLYYMAPEHRGTGIADELDRYAEKFFRKLGVRKARLRVTSSNTRAIRYYRKHGWKPVGSHPDDPNVELMEKAYR